MKRLLTLILLLLGATGVAAEELDLEQCLAEAARGNPDLAAAQASAQKARFQYKGSYSDLLPQLSAQASSGRSGGESDDGTSSTADSASYGVSLKQNLYAGGRIRAGIDQGSADLMTAEAQLQAEKAQLSYDVRQAFAGALYAQEQIALQEAIVKRRKDNADLIQLRYEGGLEHQGSLLLVQASYQDAVYQLAQARRALRVAQRQLARVLGRSEAEPIAAQGALEAAPAPAPVDFKSLAEETPARILSAAELKKARAGIDSARSGARPQLAANASASRNGEDWMPDQDQWFLGLTLSYPFFSGNQNMMNVRSARAEMTRAEASAKSRDDQVLLDLEQAYANYEDAVEQTRVLAGFVEAAEVRASIARTQYTSGLLSFENWDPIENDLISRQTAHLSGRRAAVLAEANWENVLGRSRLPETK